MKTNKTLFSYIAIAAVFLFSSSLEASGPKGPAFSLSNEKSTLYWEGSKPGGKHFGTVDVVNGSVETDGSSITGGKFSIDLETIVCNDLENKTFNKKLVGHLKSEDFFHTEEFPKAYFTINNVEEYKSTKDDFVSTHKITGDMTIRGITKEISFPAKVKLSDNMMMAETSKIVLDRTMWNVNYNSKKVFANLADNYIDDEMVIALDLRFDIK